MIEIFVDGSSVTNPGPGAWAAVIVANGRERTITGYDPATTNSRMELEAAIEGLAFFKNSRQQITVYSDSQYVVNMFEKGKLDRWAANNYRKKVSRTGEWQDVKNKDLVIRLDSQNTFHDVAWVWVRGHDGNHYNELAHQAAYSAAQEGYARDQALRDAISDSPPPSNVVPLHAESLTEGQHGVFEGVHAPETAERLREGWIDLPELTPLPDPPVSDYQRAWAVYERTSIFLLGKMHYLPTSPSEFPDGGREACILVARKLNQSDSPFVLPFGRRGRYVALPWRPSDVGRVLTEREDREIMAYMKDPEVGKVVGIGAR